MKKIFVLSLVLSFFLINTMLYALNTYNLETIGEISIGKDKGQIGWNANLVKLWGGVEVTPIVISKDNEPYITDLFNNRINLYNLKLYFIRTVEINAASYDKNICRAFKFLLDDTGGIIGIGSNIGLIKINNKGEIQYSFDKNQISETVWSKEVCFPYKDSILFYEGTTKNEKINIIDKNGKIQENGTLLEDIDSANSDNVKGVFLKLSAANSDVNNNNLHNFLRNKKIVLYDEKLLTGRCEDLREYYSMLKNLVQNKINDKATSRSADTTDFSMYKQIGYDSENNSYWERKTGKKYIAVFSKYGELLDHFMTDKNIVECAISPVGDIYFFSGNPELGNGKFQVYKITRRW